MNPRLIDPLLEATIEVILGEVKPGTETRLLLEIVRDHAHTIHDLQRKKAILKSETGNPLWFCKFKDLIKISVLC